MHGVEAVIDKDLTASLLASELAADRLLLLTDVSAVWADWSEPAEQAIHITSPESLRSMAFEPGSMAPKVEAACRFVEKTQQTAAIGAVGDACEIVGGRAGTHIRPNTDGIRLYSREARTAMINRRGS